MPVAILAVLAVVVAIAWIAGVRLQFGVDPVAERTLAEELVGRPLPSSAHDVEISHDAGLDMIVFARFTAPLADSDAFVPAVTEDGIPDACPDRGFDAVEAARLDLPDPIPPCTPFHVLTDPESGVTIRVMRLEEPAGEATVRFVAFTR